MKPLPILLFVLLIQVVAVAPSSAQLCIETDEWRTERRAIFSNPRREGSVEDFFGELQKAEARFIESNDATLARSYMDKYGSFIGQRVRDNVLYFISATEKRAPRYSDINDVIAGVNSLFPKVNFTSSCEPGTFPALVDLRIMLAAAVDTSQSYEKCGEAASHFSRAEALVRKALGQPNPTFNVPGRNPDDYRNTLKSSNSAIEAAVSSTNDCREERSQARADARRREAEARAEEAAEIRRFRQQAYDEEMARLRAQAAQPRPGYGWAPQQTQPTISSGESFPTTPQPSLSDVFRGSTSAPYRNPYAPGGR